MFNPFNFWKIEHSAKLGANEEKMTSEYAKLNDESLLRYIKVAEHAYDTAKCNKKKFNQFLNFQELKLLIHSYGYPKSYRNVRDYFAKKNKFDSKKAEVLWKTQSKKDRIVYEHEFEKANAEFLVNYFHFARSLPEARVDDYTVFSNTESDKKNNKENIEIKEFKNKYAPYEFHFEDNKDKFNEQTLYLSKVKCRTFYTQLDDKAKLVYIKKCEAAFDKHKFTEEKPILSYILNQHEMKILLISYGLPKNPGNNSSSYYYMLHSGDYKGDRMKKVFSDWKGLDEKTKNDFNAKFIKDKEEYSENKKKFKEKLPLQRLIDLDYYENKEFTETIPVGKSTKKEKTKTQKTEPNVESSEEESSVDPIDFEELDKRVLNAKKSELIEKLNTEAHYYENAFSFFVTEKLKSHQKMDETDSTSFIKKMHKEWSRLDETDKEDYENKLKKLNKEFRRSYKKNLPIESDLKIELDEIKSHIKSHARLINIKLDEQVVEELFLSEKALADLIDPAITEFVAKSKKPKQEPKQVDENLSHEKRKIGDDSEDNAKKSKSLSHFKRS